jgi:alpha-1,3-rhamnosyl/mannosyltransferase
MPQALSRAAAVLVDSEFVRQEVLTTFGVDPTRVHTVHLGVSSTFRPRNSLETLATLRAFDLEHGRYVLAIGTIEPRKNLRHVLVAHTRLPETLRARFPLVIGGAPGWRSSPLERELRGLAADGRIRFIGHVPGRSLPDLYAGAAAFVFPSLYEGFGLPPLEAMASGVPVLVSDRASLPEVVGDAALMLDPECPDDTAMKLASILDDSAAHAGLIHRGLERARAFSWESTARATLDVYRAVVADST